MKSFPESLHLLHGTDYNPDQWLGYPEILTQDIEYMKKASINCVSLGIFAWARLEPSEGVYEFGWMREIIDRLYDNGIYTVLATPSGAKPNWMSVKYEEIRRVGADGHRHLHGERHNHCFTSPVYREKTAEMNRRLAKEFSTHPGVILWHLSNEYGGTCYCPLCAEAFREWLKRKYKTLDKLNHEWWAHFWSHTYTDWEQILPPMQNGERGTHGLNLDWNRFTTDQTVDFMRNEIAAIREVDSETPVTANLMGFYPGLNYNKFSPYIDIVSWDNYPRWHKDEDDIATAAETAMAHDLMRGIQRKPFLLMESTPSTTNWMPVSRLKRPGMHMLSSLQAVAHGSNSVQYFQWRKGRGASEKFHGAVVDHDCKCDTRVFKDVAELGKRLTGLASLKDTEVKPEVALIFDWENRWAIEDARGPRNIGMNYLETFAEHYRCFWEMGVGVDIVDMEKDFDRYKLVVAPMLYMYRAGIGEKLRAFVENGGTLVGTYWSGVVNENDLCFLGATPGDKMAEVFGIRREEIDALYEGQSNAMTADGKTWKLTELCEVIHAEGAEVKAVYERDFYAGMPALTKNVFGKGRAWYLAGKAEIDFLREFYGGTVKKLGLGNGVAEKLPYGVTVSRRTGADEYFILQNFNDKETDVELTAALTDAETGVKTDKVILPAYGCAILS